MPHLMFVLFFSAGTYTVQFYDGVVRCVKRIHIKSMPEDAKGQVRNRHQASNTVKFLKPSLVVASQFRYSDTNTLTSWVSFNST